MTDKISLIKQVLKFIEYTKMPNNKEKVKPDCQSGRMVIRRRLKENSSQFSPAAILTDSFDNNFCFYLYSCFQNNDIIPVNLKSDYLYKNHSTVNLYTINHKITF